MAKVDPAEAPARAAWKVTRWGRCPMCGREQVLIRHHVVYEQHVRRAKGDPWDLRNAMWIGSRCQCHGRHHHAHRRIPYSVLPPLAVAFAHQLFGRRKAAAYFRRYYTT